MDQLHRLAIKVCKKYVLTLREEANNTADDNTKQIVATLQRAIANLLVFTERLISGSLQFNGKDAVLTGMVRVRPLLSAFTDLKNKIESTEYYEAIKTIRSIDYKLLACSHFRVHTQVSNGLRQMRQEIQRAALLALKNFLENLMEQYPAIGLIDTVEYDDNSVDLTPLISCWKLHKLIMLSDDFKEFYRRQRELQLRFVLIPPSAANVSVETYTAYLYGVYGFFVVEYQSWNADQDLSSSDWIISMFEIALTELELNLDKNIPPVIRTQLDLSFTESLKYCNLIRGPFFRPLRFLVILFNVVIVSRCMVTFHECLESWKNSEIYFLDLCDDGQAERVPASKIKSPSKGSSFNPDNRQLSAFSSMVPMMFSLVDSLMDDFTNFSKEFLTVSEQLLYLRHTLTLLVVQRFTKYLGDIVLDPLVPLDRQLQIIIDSSYLDNTSAYWFNEAMALPETQHTEHMYVKIFEAVRQKAFDRVAELVNAKIESYFQGNTYSWKLLPNDPFEISAYVKNIFNWLSTLPQTSLRIVCIRVFRVFAIKLRCIIQCPNINVITSTSLEQFNLDVLQFENFAMQRNWNHLLEEFIPLRQLLNVALHWAFNGKMPDTTTLSIEAKQLIDKIKLSKNAIMQIKKSKRIERKKLKKN